MFKCHTFVNPAQPYVTQKVTNWKSFLRNWYGHWYFLQEVGHQRGYPHNHCLLYNIKRLQFLRPLIIHNIPDICFPLTWVGAMADIRQSVRAKCENPNFNLNLNLSVIICLQFVVCCKTCLLLCYSPTSF